MSHPKIYFSISWIWMQRLEGNTGGKLRKLHISNQCIFVFLSYLYWVFEWAMFGRQVGGGEKTDPLIRSCIFPYQCAHLYSGTDCMYLCTMRSMYLYILRRMYLYALQSQYLYPDVALLARACIFYTENWSVDQHRAYFASAITAYFVRMPILWPARIIHLAQNYHRHLQYVDRKYHHKLLQTRKSTIQFQVICNEVSSEDWKHYSRPI